MGTGGINQRDVNSADSETAYFDTTAGLNSNQTWGALDAPLPIPLCRPRSCGLRAAISPTRSALPVRLRPRTRTRTRVSAPKADAVISFGLDKVANGSGAHLSTQARRIATQGSYVAKAQITGTGAVTLALSRFNSAGTETVIQAATTIAGLTYAVGDKLTVRVQTLQTNATTTTVRAKVWKTGATEPTAWQQSVTDTTAGLKAAGHVAFSSYVSSGATNGPITIAVDSLVVTAP